MGKSPDPHPFVGMKSYAIVGIWQTVTHETDGREVPCNEFYFEYEEAKKNCNGYHELEPIKKYVLEMDNGTYFMLGELVEIYEDSDDKKRRIALKKLTPEERKLLNL